jgi:hypothetical protein
MKKCLILSSNFFYSICLKSTTKTIQNGHFNFSLRWPHIFYMLFEKSYDIFSGFSVETIWKYIENFPHFLYKIFQAYFSGILSWKYWEWLLSLYLNMSSFCFFAIVFTLNPNFSNETRVWQKSIKALFIQNLEKIYHTLPNW